MSNITMTTLNNITKFEELFQMEPYFLFEDHYLFISILGSLFIGYLFGTLMFAHIVCRLFFGYKIKEHCTLNVGGLNVRLTTGSLKYFLLVILGDVSKAVIPVVLFGYIFGCYNRPVSTDPYVVRTNICWVLIGLGVIFGHRWPFWLKFKGGRSQASMLGVMVSTIPHFIIPLVSTIVLYFLPILVSVLIKKVANKFLNFVKGNKVIFIVLLMIVIPSGSTVLYQYFYAVDNSLDIKNTLIGGLPFSVTMFLEVVLGIYFFKRHIKNARRKKTKKFWSEENAKKGQVCPCETFHPKCKICVLYAKYKNLSERVSQLDPKIQNEVINQIHKSRINSREYGNKVVPFINEVDIVSSDEKQNATTTTTTTTTFTPNSTPTTKINENSKNKNVVIPVDDNYNLHNTNDDDTSNQ